MNASEKRFLDLAARRIALADALVRATDLDESGLDRIEADLRAVSSEAAELLAGPIANDGGKRKGGRLKGIFSVGPEFFEPLPEEELKAWEGR